jgi:kanamycin nucleotidyltransferase
MNHEQRVKVANKITEMFLEKYGDEVCLGGVYGSTAKDTDTEYSDLEMFFIVKNESKAKSFDFAYHGMPVGVFVQKIKDVEKDIREIAQDWPLKMGRLFNLKITCGDRALLKRFRETLEKVPKERFANFIAEETPLCYEGLGRLKAVKVRGNTYETGLFVAEILMEFTLLTAIFNREFINHDYLDGLFESFKFKRLPKDYEKIARKLVEWNKLSIDETIRLADEFVRNFVRLMRENEITVKEHTPLEKVNM